MTEKYVLVEHRIEVKSLFQNTQRIKFTAFDVSKRLLILGASSGGIYIFSRDPCQFLKLIPSVHGPAVLISLSENEENLALAMSTGLIIIIEKFRNSTFEQRLYTQHDSQIVNVLKWHGNYLYCGDNSGKVSVIPVINFVNVVMFHAPSCCLMNLESQIVQIDTYSKFLLVSTQTRSLLCDTESEQYQQIGKKLRDGPFGACFFNTKTVPMDNNNGFIRNSRGLFKLLDTNEKFPTKEQNEVKIFCARPKARLWNADFEAEVISTVCFIEALNKTNITEIIRINQDEFTVEASAESDSNDNFGKLFNIDDKFIFTFLNDRFCIFEPELGELPIWCGQFKNLRDAKVVDNSIFIWHGDVDISILSLALVEDLLLKALTKKQYQLCVEICKTYYDHIIKLLETSQRIHVLTALELNVKSEDVEKLRPIFDRLKELAKSPPSANLKNGIETVNNNNNNNSYENPISILIPEDVENFVKPKTFPKPIFDILSEQFRLNKINAKLETSRFVSLVKSLGVNKMCENLDKFYGEISKSDENLEGRTWCQDTLLRLLENSTQEISKLDPKVIEFASCSFFDLNRQDSSTCNCDFPLPKAHKTKANYFDLGCRLMDLSDNYDSFTKIVPYMNKLILERIEDSREIMLKLPLIIQFSDEEVLDKLSGNITYDIWDAAIRLLVKLRDGLCLHCGNKIDCGGVLEWKNLALCMVRSINARNAVELLKQHSNSIQNGALDEIFYQHCIFQAASALDADKCNPFVRILKQDPGRKQFEKSVGGYLRKQYLRNMSPSVEVHQHQSMNSTCDYCHLPLKTPVIDDINKLGCGHTYHKVCLFHKHNKCCLCDNM